MPTKWGKPIRVPEKTTARMSAHPPVWKDGALGVMGGAKEAITRFPIERDRGALAR